MCFTDLNKVNLLILILSSRQFSILPQQPQNMTLAVKVVKIDWKIIISLPQSEFVKHLYYLVLLEYVLRENIIFYVNKLCLSYQFYCQKTKVLLWWKFYQNLDKFSLSRIWTWLTWQFNLVMSFITAPAKTALGSKLVISVVKITILLR